MLPPWQNKGDRVQAMHGISSEAKDCPLWHRSFSRRDVDVSCTQCTRHQASIAEIYQAILLCEAKLYHKTISVFQSLFDRDPCRSESKFTRFQSQNSQERTSLHDNISAAFLGVRDRSWNMAEGGIIVDKQLCRYVSLGEHSYFRLTFSCWCIHLLTFSKGTLASYCTSFMYFWLFNVFVSSWSTDSRSSVKLTIKSKENVVKIKLVQSQLKQLACLHSFICMSTSMSWFVKPWISISYTDY